MVTDQKHPSPPLPLTNPKHYRKDRLKIARAQETKKVYGILLMIRTCRPILNTQNASRDGARGGSHSARHHQERTVAKNGTPGQEAEMCERRRGWGAIAVTGLRELPWADEVGHLGLRSKFPERGGRPSG